MHAAMRLMLHSGESNVVETKLKIQRVENQNIQILLEVRLRLFLMSKRRLAGIEHHVARWGLSHMGQLDRP